MSWGTCADVCYRQLDKIDKDRFVARTSDFSFGCMQLKISKWKGGVYREEIMYRMQTQTTSQTHASLDHTLWYAFACACASSADTVRSICMFSF